MYAHGSENEATISSVRKQSIKSLIAFRDWDICASGRY